MAEQSGAGMSAQIALNTDNSDPRARLKARDSDKIASTTAKALVRLADYWRLKNADAAHLIGVSGRTWERMKGGSWSGRFSQDQLQRASALIGLYKALHLYFSDALADEWVMLENTGPMFGGRRPLHVMAEGGLPAILDIRDYVDALRGGV